jgi:hypothetical protein
MAKTSSVKIGAGWIKFTENGKQYISIKLEEAITPITIRDDRFLTLWEIPDEERKDKEKSPHYTLCIAKTTEE